MTYNKEKKQSCFLLVPQRKPYVVPCASSIPIETTTTLLAGSGPDASIEDNKYGGKVYNEDIDDN